MFLWQLTFIIFRSLCGRLSLLECKFVRVWCWNLYFKCCGRLRYLWELAENFEKGDNFQFKKILFLRYALCLEVYVPFIYICHFLRANSFFRYQKFCFLNICKCGAVVECKARDLGISGSCPACVDTIFNRWCGAHVKLCLSRNTSYMRKFPCDGSVNLGKMGCIFTHFWRLYAISKQ